MTAMIGDSKSVCRFGRVGYRNIHFTGPMVVAGEDEEDDDEDREISRDFCGSRVWSGQNWGWTSL